MDGSAKTTAINFVLHNLAAILIGCGIGLISTVNLAALADNNGWFCVNSSVLYHGGGLGVFLLFSLIGFHIAMRLAMRFRIIPHASEFGWLAHLAYVCGAIAAWRPDWLVGVPEGMRTAAFVCAVLGTIAGSCAIGGRLCGRTVPNIGIAAIGIVVSAVSLGEYLVATVLYA